MERRAFFKLAGLSAFSAAAVGVLSSCENSKASSLFDQKNSVAGQPSVSFADAVDILIVGSGIAGLSAAMAPAEAGQSVLVVDKLDLLGGESFDSNGLMRVAGSSLQTKAGLKATAQEVWPTYKKKLTKAKEEDLSLAEQLFLTAPTWVDKLASSYNVQFANPADYAQDGLLDDIILPKNGLRDTESIMIPLRDKLSSQGVRFQTGYRAVAFILNQKNKIIGMRFNITEEGTTADIRAKRIVIATGGFTSSQSLVKTNADTRQQARCCTHASIGEGQLMCSAVGGALTGMDASLPLTSDLSPAAAWGLFAPTLAVDALGRRFAREDDENALAEACFTDEHGYWWTIFGNQLAKSSQSRSVSEVTSKHDERLVGPCENIKTLAAGMGIAEETLQKAFDSYEKIVDEGKDKNFGRTTHLKKLKPPYRALKQFPVRYRSRGGVQTDASGCVLNAAGSTVQNIYCCGSAAAGGIEGLAACGTSGMIAGQAAAKSLREENERYS